MPKRTGATKANLLDESNSLSIIGGSGGGSSQSSAQHDYYELQARQLKTSQGISGLGQDEWRYVFGSAKPPAGSTGIQTEANSLFKLHESDLIELKALKYLHSLPDTSPHLLQMKSIYKCGRREEIAKKMAEEQMNDLIKAQMSAVIRPEALQTLYKQELKESADAFKNLY
jgi:hypothetical protein